MPYVIQRKGKQWCVVTEGTGKSHGCHDTRAEAIKQQRALYKNAPPAEEAAKAAAVMTDLATESKALDDEFLAELTEHMVKKIENPAEASSTVSGIRVPIEMAERIRLILMSSDQRPTLGAMSESTEAEVVETAAETEASDVEEAPAAMWEGILAFEGKPTDDGRFLMEIDHRELPLSLMAQIVTKEGHDEARLAAKITEIWRVDTEDEQGRTVTEIWGRGPFDMEGEYGAEIARLVKDEFLLGISIDFNASDQFPVDEETYEVIDVASLSPEEQAVLSMEGNFLLGMKGTIMGATLVPFPAFAESRVAVITASAGRVIDSEDEITVVRKRFKALIAAAGPVKPPYDWFKDPYLRELTPLTITKEGQVYGHLADWDGCHTGFQGVCVPPFRSMSDYAFFNVGEIETAEGELVPCGKLMFCMDGSGHAPTDEYLGYEEIHQYYDDATKVGAFVRAGADKFGTWLAGSLRPGLSDIEIQHLRTHPPSGDWRPIKNGPSDLVAAFSVPIPGFPIARGRALVASAGGEITAIISGPLELEEMGHRARMRKKAVLGIRLREALGAKGPTKAELRARAILATKTPTELAEELGLDTIESDGEVVGVVFPKS